MASAVLIDQGKVVDLGIWQSIDQGKAVGIEMVYLLTPIQLEYSHE